MDSGLYPEGPGVPLRVFNLEKTWSDPLQTYCSPWLQCFSSFHSLSLKFLTDFKLSKSHPSFLHELKCLPVTVAGNEFSLDPELPQHPGQTTQMALSKTFYFGSYILSTILSLSDQSFSKNSFQDHLSQDHLRVLFRTMRPKTP